MQLRGGQFVAELRGLAQSLQHEVGEIYSPVCRARLGDSRCGVNMSAHTFTGTMQQILGRTVFADVSRTQDSGYFDHGVVEILSGVNTGFKSEVKGYVKGEVTLLLPPPQPLEIGSSYRIKAGCDKAFSTCRTRFSNGVNFRGEPHVPGLDKLF